MKKIVGLTPVSVVVGENSWGADTIVMTFSNGQQATWYHEQDCCESVYISEITGDFQDLVGHPLLGAEERDNSESSPHGLETWTFYTFRSIGGSVDVTWRGESNGYYSTSVNFKLELAK